MVPLTCKGFTACGMAAGIKKNDSLDLGMLVSDRPARVAAVFTRNRVQAAPVKLDRERVKSGSARAVIVNAGNANCANGPQGLVAAEAMAAAAARVLNLPDEQVLVASTGVIGAPFPIHKVEAAMPALAGGLSPNGLPDLARAIMTTDTRPKTGAREGSLDGVSYRIVAVAKGAGMIRPDMATMLCFICTDADIPVSNIQMVLKRSVDGSFNRITIDGDSSTNDTVILLANGASGVRIETDNDRVDFQRLLDDLCMDLARQMVKDGEGVTKVVDLTVCGARSDEDARAIADTIAHSPLVKTAFFGEDANWGRIIAAAGRAGVFLDPERLDLYFDDVQMVKDGTGCGPDAEEKATGVLKKPEFSVALDLNQGEGTASMLTCDFSLDYVKINADYRS
ncbi:bifunctional glutamate N-acetyltransferase/amino-acid acetyltransferase ArgJ [Desulfosarcina sp.]|uniref:bifunctional glutamate N-acetyltransferase/amino-acid acetyltransferase ArgJ n=1 Tax=Desulfosarcina sp. TaxID=2027861 RepID=UPI0029BBCA82|nr:bifunctional glutamate N-acetyltransferase/amino-acid acetyltransferase ArgJ [Desulfosarcina sp.]MDX2454033.1 bifunctional glutamate N-acetyltransferase/amino-acid acetyltransferase ArgJ [Desulfosarcina sp.]MDX2491720.1 bifunctional glutamate N-acetyltransferase/amino-acid acetyltransferase ArgJ [Desulfosarcina sp.]